MDFFSVQPLCPLYLCGEELVTTETQRTQWTCLDFVDTLKDPE